MLNLVTLCYYEFNECLLFCKIIYIYTLGYIKNIHIQNVIYMQYKLMCSYNIVYFFSFLFSNCEQKCVITVIQQKFMSGGSINK